MRNMIFVLFEERDEGRFSRLEYIVDPRGNSPEEVLATIRGMLIGQPLGPQSSLLSQDTVFANTQIVDFYHPGVWVLKMREDKVKDPISFERFKLEIERMIKIMEPYKK